MGDLRPTATLHGVMPGDTHKSVVGGLLGIWRKNRTTAIGKFKGRHGTAASGRTQTFADDNYRPEAEVRHSPKQSFNLCRA
jgi:hypothetical protein